MEFGVRVGVHQRSVPSLLLFIIVLEAVSREFRTGCPWDDLNDQCWVHVQWGTSGIVEDMESEIEKTGLRVNMGMTRIIVSGLDLDLLKKSGKDPCGVCQKGVGSNAIACGGCLFLIHKKCNGINGPLVP